MRHAGSVLALCQSAPDPNNLSGVIWTHSPAEKGYANTWAILDVCVVQKFFQSLHACIFPRPLCCLNGNISFPLTKSGVIKYRSLHVCDWENDWCKLGGLYASVPCLLTYVSPPRLDDNGTPTASLLLNLGHAFPGLLVGVVCCTYCNLVLDHTQTIQLNAPFTTKAKRKPWERKTGRETDWKRANIVLYYGGCYHKILKINPSHYIQSLTICNNPCLHVHSCPDEIH